MRRRSAILAALVGLISVAAAAWRRRTATQPLKQGPLKQKQPMDQGQEIYPWSPDQGDGTYRNPILFADYSDPDAIRVGEEYFLTASSFTSTPGLPILSSRDLVNWTLIGHALENLPDPRYREVQHGAGVWAPALRERAGTFYLFAPTPDEGIYVLRAPHPRGPWSEPQLLLEGKGLIDPCPLWDDDGQAYLVHAYARSRAGIKDRLRVRPMAADASRVLGEGEIVYHDPDRQPTLEGPKLYKRNGYYYLLAPAGGVEHGWQLALRSRHIYGPYEARTVLEQGSTPINGPHQGALVDTPGGQHWFLHFQDAGVYGRIVHLNPVAWRDDWPMMGENPVGSEHWQPVLQHAKPELAPQPRAAPASSDEFDDAVLSPAWQWHANHSRDWCSPRARPGYLRLVPVFAPELDLWRAPSALLQKLPARAFLLETSVELAETRGLSRAGLVVMGESHAALALTEQSGGQRLDLLVDNRSIASATLAPGAVRLRVAFASGGLCRFEYALAQQPFVALEPRFQARKGRWVGAQVGLFAVCDRSEGAPGHADFSYFRFAPPEA